VLSLIKVAIARTKKPIRTKFIQWSARDGALVIEKRAIIPPIPLCKCQIIENDKILTFCNLSPKKTNKKSHIKIE